MKVPRSQFTVSDIEAGRARGSNPGIVPASDSLADAVMSSAVTTAATPGKRVAIVQSNYIPWKGYFDMIAAVDEFILLDDVQYTRRDWRNRNQIKTASGPQWLTVPVEVKGKYSQKIRDTEIHGTEWAASHWKTLYQNYRRAECFAEVAAWVEPLYLGETYSHLSRLNRRFIEAICGYLEIQTRITDSSDYRLPEGKTERLASLCEQAGG